jgi:hypothetical protein
LTTFPNDYNYDGNDAAVGDPTDPEDLGEWRHEERITDIEDVQVPAVETRLDLLEAVDIGKVYRGASHILATNTNYDVVWDTAEYEGHSHDWWNVTNPTRLVAPYDGWYLVHVQVSFAAGTAGYRTMKLRKNGNIVSRISQGFTGSAVADDLQATHIGPFTAGQYIEARIKHLEGVNLVVTGGSNYCYASMALLRKT